MHADEVDHDVSLVGRLVAAQFPQWAGLRIESVLSSGTDNALYRLGEDLVVRLPRKERSGDALEKERRWLPSLAPLLPLAVPSPLAEGQPGEGYPFEWSVYRWLGGDDATRERIADQSRFASDLARFIAALQEIDATAGRPQVSTTSSAARRLPSATPGLGARSSPSATRSTPTLRPPRGNLPCGRRSGSGRLSGSTETSTHETCSPETGV